MKRILFAPLTKVVELDDGTVEAHGRAAAQEPDPQKEVFDYEASKPFIKTWSDDIFQASGGQSLGNLRAMHNPRVAAGKLTALEFNDTEQAVDVVAKVVDANEVNKVRAGVYTGFSFGGAYGPKRVVDGLTYYAAVPTELSLADNPMIKSARFTLVKVDGSQEEKDFQRPQAGTPALPAAEAGTLQKRLNDVGRMASRLYDLRCLLGDVAYEAEAEGDGSSIPARLQAAFLNLVEIFKDFAAEEAEELAVNVRALLEQPVGEMAMNKVYYSQGATPAPQGGSTYMTTLEQLEGVVKDLGERLEKVEGDFSAQVEQLGKVKSENADLKERLAKVEAQPAPAKGVLKAVGKDADALPLAKTDGPSEEDMIKNKDTLGLIKAAHEKPLSLG
ncbi:MAG: hypothetical protein FJ121_08950 [Deltaproteobacteria bacterium]|nr:hypothetical protein [Deltaproteobacteria bacterium]